MERMNCRYRQVAGFTMIELAIVIVVIAIMSAVVALGIDSFSQDADATVATTVQSTLEQIIGQASVRRDVSPQSIVTDAGDRGTLMTVMQRNLGGLVDGSNFNCNAAAVCTLTLNRGPNNSAPRIINYFVSNTGEVTVIGTFNLPKYRIVNGALTR